MKAAIRRSHGPWVGVVATLAAICMVAVGGAAWAGDSKLKVATASVNGREAAANELLVKFRQGQSPQAVVQALAQGGIKAQSMRKYRLIDWYRVTLSSPQPLGETIRAFSAQPGVLAAEPNYVVHAVGEPDRRTPEAWAEALKAALPRRISAPLSRSVWTRALNRIHPLLAPDDPLFSQLWGMTQISAPSAWDILTDASTVIVAVIDTGVDVTHEDLQANIWLNTNETLGTTGIDDDFNGYVDDDCGWDFYENDNTPDDEVGHGTHVAGTIGAEGNNGTGVAGVCWQVQIMPVKFLEAAGGFTADAIDAIEYAVLNGATVLNNSWGGGGYSAPLQEVIYAAGGRGCIFVAAAGNTANNNDAIPFYPASYNNANIISVAASNRNDALVSVLMNGWGSNYGASSVDLAAPGLSILSTVPGGYGTYSGTSMAAPHVSGACALLWAQYPYLSHLELKDKILASVFVPVTYPPNETPLAGRVVTGGRLDVYRAMALLRIMTASPLPKTVAGEAYSVTLTAAGGTPPYTTWAVTVGALPPGLALDPVTGVLSGTTTDPNGGTSNFTVRVTDSLLGTAQKGFQIVVEPGNRVILRVHASPYEEVSISGTSSNQNPVAGAVSGRTFYTAVFLQPNPPTVYGAYVYLTAPERWNQLFFKEWQDGNGNTRTTSLTCSVYMGSNQTAVAVYGPVTRLWVNDEEADTYAGGLTVLPGDDINSGLTPAAPKRTIQEMLDNPPVPLGFAMEIFVSKGTYRETVKLRPQHSRTILRGAGWGPDGTIIDGGSVDSCIYADGWRDGTITGFEITNGLADQGGAIRLSNGAQVTLLRNYMHDNSAEEGGAIAGYSCTATVESNIITDNTAAGEGGGIYFSESYVIIYGNKIGGNSARSGGGIRCFLTVGLTRADGVDGIQKNWIYGNTVTAEGGGICAKSSSVNITYNVIGADVDDNPSPNTANVGGGIYAFLTSNTIAVNTIEFNSAATWGGGVALEYQCSANMTGNTIQYNVAGTDGGGLACKTYCTPAVTGCTFTGNQAHGNGGGIYMIDHCSFANTTFAVDGNHADFNGGGVYMAQYCSISLILSSSISGNSAGISGGGIFMIDNCSSTIGVAGQTGRTSNTISSNAAALHGGAIYLEKSCSPTIIANDIEGNVAAAGSGGALYMANGCSPVIGDPSRYGYNYMDVNTAGVNGGAIYVGFACLPQIGPSGPYFANDIYDSVAGNWGGGICSVEGSSPSIRNNVIGYGSAVKGGGIYCAGTAVQIGGNYIYDNEATDPVHPENAQGGGIYFTPENTSVVSGNSIDYNTATTAGGIYCPGTQVQLLVNFIYGNQAVTAGGIYCLDGDKAYISGNDITSNQAAVAPGVYVVDSSPTLNGNTIEDHSLSSGAGAGLRSENSTVLIQLNAFSYNAAPMGAGIYEENSTLTIAGNVFQQNTATIAGAGAYLTDSSVVIKAMDPDKIPNTFIANLAPDGAGLYCQGAISPTISRARFGENRGTRGAGMFLNSASPALSNLLIVGNSADQGGGIYCAGSRSSPTIKNCTLIANFADMAFGGGGVYTDLGSPQVSNSVLWGNRDDLANCSATYSDVQDGGAGAGNIIAEPLFMGPGFSGTITSISHWTNGTSGINFVGGGVKVDELIGLYLNPNIQQNVHFYIYDNTTSTLSVRGFAGYVATVGDQFQVWDWHEKSTGGHWGRNAWVLDPVTSPCINRGDPRDSVGKEPQPHGNRINMGHDGGTEQASKSGQVTPGGFQHGVISITDSWTQVTFPEEFSDAPVVIASPATENDRAPGVVRIRNVTKTSFQIRFQEWSYLDGSHGTETVHWVAVMKGVWNLGGGRKLFADTFVTNNTNVNLPLTVIFPESAGIVPVVLAQIQTYNDSHPVTHRICATFTTRFKIAMQEQMTSRRTHGRETIGYIAVNRGVTQIGNASCQVNITGTVVTDDPYLLYTAKGQCLIRVSEEQSKDKNTTHTKETVGYIALDGRLPVVADMQTCLGKDPADLRCKLLATNFQWERSYVAADHNWKTVNLKNTYTSPIVIAGPATYNDRTPGVVRVRQVGRTSFKIRFQEWKYIKDQRHRTEYIPYMVVEQGVWNINGAQTLVAHKPNVVGTTSLRFPAGFTVAPVVVATQQTANDPDPVTERLSLISTTAFRVALQEEQAGGAHGKETLGYVAVGAGTAGVQGGVVGLRTGTGNPQDWRIVITEEQSKDKETSHRAETIRYISFNGASHTRPYFVASMQTCNDPDPATLRCYTTLSSLEYGLAISAEDKEGQGLSAVAIQAAAQKDAEAAVILTDAEPVLRSYPSGTAVTVTAPDSLALAQRTLTFDHWEVDGEAQQAGLSTIKLLMTDNHSVAAVYELPPSSAP